MIQTGDIFYFNNHVEVIDSLSNHDMGIFLKGDAIEVVELEPCGCCCKVVLRSAEKDPDGVIGSLSLVSIADLLSDSFEPLCGEPFSVSEELVI
jgi:hypothetical protein